MPPVDVEFLDEWWAWLATGEWVTIRFSAITATDEQKIGTRTTQFAECRVDGKTALVVWTPHPQLPCEEQLSLTQALLSQFEGALVAFVLATSEGRIQIDTSPCQPVEARLVISAAAVVQACWAWDESERICVEDRAGTFLIEPRFDGSRWRATLISS